MHILALVTYRKVTLYGSFEIVTIYVFEYGKDHPSIKPILYVCKLSKTYFPVPWQSIVHLFYTKEKPKHAITMRRKEVSIRRGCLTPSPLLLGKSIILSIFICRKVYYFYRNVAKDVRYYSFPEFIIESLPFETHRRTHFPFPEPLLCPIGTWNIWILMSIILYRKNQDNLEHVDL